MTITLAQRRQGMRRTRRQKELGLCVSGNCQSPPEEGRTRCRKHLDENAKSMRKILNEKRKRKCKVVGCNNLTNGLRCFEHYKRIRGSPSRRRTMRRYYHRTKKKTVRR